MQFLQGWQASSYLRVCGYVIRLANATDALQIFQMALGIGPGNEIITPGFTYIATAETVALRGAKPVYDDIDPLTYKHEPSVARIRLYATYKSHKSCNLSTIACASISRASRWVVWR